MGCICGKPIVKASVSKVKTFKSEKPKQERPQIPNIPLQETSNESDRILINQPSENKKKCSKIYEFPRKTVLINSTSQIKTKHLPPSDPKSLEIWTNLLKSHKDSSIPSLKPVKSTNRCISNEWDLSFLLDLTIKILQLPSRNWVEEELEILQNVKKSQSLKEKRKNFQLKFQFQWLLWAVRNVWFFFINGKSSRVGIDFESLSGVKVDLPENPEDWFEGFEFKNVWFQVTLRGSESAKTSKNELKAMKNLYLDSLISENSLLFPFFHLLSSSIYQFSAVPSYPEPLSHLSNDLFLSLMSNPHLLIPKFNLFLPSTSKSLTLAHNFLTFMPFESSRSLLALFDCKTSKIHLSLNHFESSASKSEIADLLYPEGFSGRLKISQNSFTLHGWNCLIFWDNSSKTNTFHPFSQFFAAVPGNFLVIFLESRGKVKRQVDVNLSRQKNPSVLKASLKTCANQLEIKEAINSQEALEELIHRKGLRKYHQWILYSKSRSERTCSLLEGSLLARALKKSVQAEAAENPLVKAKKLNSRLAGMINSLLKKSLESDENVRKIAFALFIDRLSAVSDLLRIENQSDVSSSRIIESIPNKMNSATFFKTTEIIEKILTVPERHPKTFLLSLEHQMNFKFESRILIQAGNDPFQFLDQQNQVQAADVVAYSNRFFSIVSLREECFLMLRKLELDVSNDDFSSEDNSQILLFHRESELASSEMIYPADLYSKNPLFFSESYSLPDQQILESWLSSTKKLSKDVISPQGDESFTLEILYKLIQIQSSNNKSSSTSEILQSNLSEACKLLDDSFFTPADEVISFFMSAGLASEYSDHMASEQSYMTCLLLLTRLYGDPRGRLNLGTPWQLTAAWKLSKLSREDKRIQDAQLAEEHFDSIFMKTSGFLHSSQKKYSKSSAKQQASIYSSPFESCSDPLWEDVLAWVVSNCVCMFSTGVLWNKAEVREFIRLTQVVQPLSQMVNTSGASTPSSSKESKRTGHQCSLSQAVLMQEFALNVENLKGVVYVWGSDTEGQLGISIDHQFTQVQMYPRMVTALKDQVVCEIAAGALHCVAVTVNGTCFAWGNNDQGQLGLGPEMPPVVASPVHVKAINLIKSAACGYQHSVFLTVSGNILTCGLGEGGVLGHSNSKSCSYPKTILSMTKIPFSSIVSGAFHSLALTPSGSLFVWGRGEGGQLGLDPEDLQKSGQDLFIDSPTRVQGVLSDLKIIQVASGEAHNLALTSQGKVFAWGWGSNGQLGNGFREEDFEEAGNMLSIQYNPSLIIAFNFPIKQVAAGGLFSMFLSADNEVFICGANDKKQLGLEGQNKDVAIPTRIEAFTGYPVESVACGESHCIAVAPKMVWTWGNHLDHRLGLGEMQTFSMPRPLQSLANAQVEKLSCGRMHSMALIGKVDKAGGLVSDVNFCVKAFGECKIEF